jgi:hypothetical protein
VVSFGILVSFFRLDRGDCGKHPTLFPAPRIRELFLLAATEKTSRSLKKNSEASKSCVPLRPHEVGVAPPEDDEAEEARYGVRRGQRPQQAQRGQWGQRGQRGHRGTARTARRPVHCSATRAPHVLRPSTYSGLILQIVRKERWPARAV